MSRNKNSMFVLAEGNANLGQRLKEQSLRTIRVVTDDSEITLGYLLRDDEQGQIRVGHCLGYVRDNYEFEKRQKWQVVAIARNRVSKLTTLN